MKQFKLLTIFLTLFTLIGFSACGDDDNRDIREYQLTVASVQRLVVTLDHHSPYFAKIETQTQWQSHQAITGFSHTEGYEYVLRVRTERVIFDDVIGGSPYETTLLEEISKVKKDSENIPKQNIPFRIASKKTGDENMPFYALNNMTGGWVKFPSITGFVHEDGYEYMVGIACKYNGVDAEPKYSYSFLEIISKEKKDTIGLPI